MVGAVTIGPETAGGEAASKVVPSWEPDPLWFFNSGDTCRDPSWCAVSREEELLAAMTEKHQIVTGSFSVDAASFQLGMGKTEGGRDQVLEAHLYCARGWGLFWWLEAAV